MNSADSSDIVIFLFQRFDHLTDTKTGRGGACECLCMHAFVEACVSVFAFMRWRVYACVCAHVGTSVRKYERLRAVACGCVRMRAFTSVRTCTRGTCAYA